MRVWMIILVIMLSGFVVLLTQLTFFVIQPIGALPEGITVVTWRTGALHFIDSPDGVCQRVMQSVNLLCRLTIAGTVLDKDRILLRLPYSETLYLWSTRGVKYDR